MRPNLTSNPPHDHRSHRDRGASLRALGMLWLAVLAAACNVSYLPPPALGEHEAACGGDCHADEHCDRATATCKPGCVTDADCDAMTCVKADGGATGQCTATAPTPPPGDAPAPAGVAKPIPPPVPPLPTCPASSKRCNVDLDCAFDETCGNGLCVKKQAGCACSGQVGSCGFEAHCFEGTCYPNTPPFPCEDLLHCGAGSHCFEKRCWPSASGSPCTPGKSGECGFDSSCVDGVCN